MSEKQLNVLFLCDTNASLSIFGEAILNRLGRPKFRGFSAGREPADKVDDLTRYQLNRNNYDDQDLQVDDWNDFVRDDAPSMDIVISLSSELNADDKDWPGNPMITSWRIDDPTRADGNDLQRKAAYARALTELESRISIFVNLPIESLDRLKLQQRLNAIGRTATPV